MYAEEAQETPQVMTNPLAHLYADFNSGDPADKLRDLADFPRMLDIELTSSCNFRCLMCPTGNRSLDRPAKFMRGETFFNIIEQSEGRVEAIRFIGWGEPTLHPDLAEMIHAAHNHGILTHVNTNGSKIGSRSAQALVGAGLDSIKFSFQGVDRASYAEMRSIDFYEGMIEAIVTMLDARGGGRTIKTQDGLISVDTNYPWIAASTTTTWEDDDMIAAFVERVGPLVDELSIGKTIFDFMNIDRAKLRRKDRRRLHELKKASKGDEKAHPDPCPEVFGKLSIHADGSVVLCCNDYDGVVELGNVNKSHIEDMWRHPKIEAYRERLARKDYEAPLCETCFDYMGTTA